MRGERYALRQRLRRCGSGDSSAAIQPGGTAQCRSSVVRKAARVPRLRAQQHRNAAKPLRGAAPRRHGARHGPAPAAAEAQHVFASQRGRVSPSRSAARPPCLAPLTAASGACAQRGAARRADLTASDVALRFIKANSCDSRRRSPAAAARPRSARRAGLQPRSPRRWTPRWRLSRTVSTWTGAQRASAASQAATQRAALPQEPLALPVTLAALRACLRCVCRCLTHNVTRNRRYRKAIAARGAAWKSPARRASGDATPAAGSADELLSYDAVPLPCPLLKLKEELASKARGARRTRRRRVARSHRLRTACNPVTSADRARGAPADARRRRALRRACCSCRQAACQRRKRLSCCLSSCATRSSALTSGCACDCAFASQQ